jgi:hypothetical protein
MSGKSPEYEAEENARHAEFKAKLLAKMQPEAAPPALTGSDFLRFKKGVPYQPSAVSPDRIQDLIVILAGA